MKLPLSFLEYNFSPLSFLESSSWKKKYLFPSFCFYCQRESSMKKRMTKKLLLPRQGDSYCSFTFLKWSLKLHVLHTFKITDYKILSSLINLSILFFNRKASEILSKISLFALFQILLLYAKNFRLVAYS